MILALTLKGRTTPRFVALELFARINKIIGVALLTNNTHYTRFVAAF